MRSMDRCRALYTTPIPPSPMHWRISYRPSITVPISCWCCCGDGRGTNSRRGEHDLLGCRDLIDREAHLADRLGASDLGDHEVAPLDGAPGSADYLALPAGLD